MNTTPILATEPTVKKTIEALKKNGIDAFYFSNREEAKKKVFELIPEGSEVFVMTSVTLNTLDIPKVFDESGKYDSIRAQFAKMDCKTQGREMRKMGASPDFAIGSVHAVTEDGKVLIASNTGSQLPAYAYGAGKVVWVVGTQKIVTDFEAGLKRVYEYVLPLESDRANKAYNMTAGSAVRKLLTVNSEGQAGRMTIVFINEVLGF